MADWDREQLGELLSAYMDGELDSEESQRVERLLQADPEARRLLEELRRSVSAVSSLPRHPAPDAIAEEVRLHIERSALLGETERPYTAAGARRGPALAFLATAAAVALIVVGWQVMTVQRGSIFDDVDSVVLAPEASPERAVREQKKTEPGGRGSKGPRAPATSPADKILEAATLEQKLKAGEGIACAKEHRFANEPVQLEVTVPDESQGEEVAARLVAYLKERGVPDLAGETEDMAARDTIGSFVHIGDPVGNSFDPKQRQVLVRVTREGLDGMLGEVERVTGRSDNVRLESPLGSCEGNSRVRFLISGLERAPAIALAQPPSDFYDAAEERDRELEEMSSKASPKSSADGTALLDEVAESLGIETGAADVADRRVSESSPTREPDTSTRVADASTAATGKGEPFPTRGVETEKKSAAKPLDRSAGTSRDKKGRLSLPYGSDDNVASGDVDDHDSGHYRGKAPDARSAAKRSSPSLLERRQTLVGRAKKKLEEAGQDRPAETEERSAVLAEVPAKGAVVPPVEAAPAFVPPANATYVTLVLRIDVAQPQRSDAAMREKKLTPPTKKSVE
jgi:hypothetical protein